MCKNYNVFKMLFVLLIAGLLVLGIQGPKVEAQTTTDPTFSYFPFMGMGMMGMGRFPWMYSNLGSLDFSNLGSYPFMGGMMGMGRFNPWLYSSLGSGLDTTSLGYPYMGGMMGMMGMGGYGRPYWASGTTLDTSSLGLGYPYMGGMMGMMGMGGFGHFNPWLYSNLGSLDLSNLGYFPYMGMGGFGHFNPYLYSSLLGTTPATVTPIT